MALGRGFRSVYPYWDKIGPRLKDVLSDLTKLKSAPQKGYTFYK